ncbi:flagellar hook-associated protein FlgK [Microvirga terricola]|uniref:Flagellar hook-associated protein 1 n=1 Tax=Microvirga terricola TaxID=2719797 RepID=A0ABX0VEZ6_9HYPH|nr:flagellar hook-associated protein FlgK [Microvirga terricola]NIX78415.1 flagellar hook-associated protein FlgK [Microvirga terricola]
MALSLALNTARSSLQASSSQLAVVSRNTAGATDPSYSRKIATLVTGGGSARVSITRASDPALFFKMLGATSDLAGKQAISDGLDRLKQTVSDTALNQSPAARIGALNSALQQYAKEADNPILAKAVLTRASDLAAALNDATKTIQKVREDADAEMVESVNRVNDLLRQFETVNRAVVKGTASGADVTDSLDTRDHILAQLSEEMGITIATRDNNDVAIYTESGVALFEKTARSVTFNPTHTYSAGTVGSAVYIDGVQVTGAGAPMPLHSGRIVGLATVRDDIAPAYQAQLDEVARGLVEAFAESDQSAVPVLPDSPGLFTYPGGPALPSGAALKGLAGTISINALVDPDQGGNLDLLRDGGVNGASYVYNPSAPGTNAAFSDRLYELGDKIASDRAFDPTLGLGATASLQGFAASSAGWLEATRKDAATAASYQTTLLGRASEALSNATGVNTDDETAMMLQLEKSYAASAKLISVIDEMLRTLLSAVR